MRKSGVRLAIALCLLLVPWFSYPQSVSAALHIEADVPFDFVVGETIFPPGHYTIRSFGASDGKTLSIQGSDARWKTIVRVHSVQASKVPEQCTLRFLSYSGRYFLSELWLPGDALGEQLPTKSKAVRMARRLGSDQVVITAQRR